MYSLIQRDIRAQNANKGPGSPRPNANGHTSPNGDAAGYLTVPALFTDPGYNLLGTSVLSTSNCGNPALRLFGFGPVTPEGYGIGYIIKDEGLSVCMSSKHLQTRRLLNTLQAYLLEVRGMLIGLWKEANERPEAFVDHAGVLRDARTGKAINTEVEEGKTPGDEEMRQSATCPACWMGPSANNSQWAGSGSSMWGRRRWPLRVEGEGQRSVRLPSSGWP